MADQKPLTRYVGDDWVFGPVTLFGDERPLDLTDAAVTGLFFAAYHPDPVLVLTEGNGITVAPDRTAGVLPQVWIPRAVTSAVQPQNRRETRFGTRLAIVVTDSQGKSRTCMIVLFQALDRRCDVPPAEP